MIRNKLIAGLLLGALALAGCAVIDAGPSTVAVGPVISQQNATPPAVVVQPAPAPAPASHEIARVFIKYGAGGYALSPAMGPGAGTLGAKLQSKFGARVKIVGYYQWTDAIASLMASTPAAIKLVSFGDSCGASAGPYDAAAVNRTVDLIGGFQPSIYCGGGGGFTEPVPANVLSAIEVYNPSCISTGGLGCRLWTLAANFPASRLLIVSRPDMHPGVNADSEQDMIDALSAALAPAAKLKALRAPLGSKPRLIVRHHGERI